MERFLISQQCGEMGVLLRFLNKPNESKSCDKYCITPVTFNYHLEEVSTIIVIKLGIYNQYNSMLVFNKTTIPSSRVKIWLRRAPTK